MDFIKFTLGIFILFFSICGLLSIGKYRERYEDLINSENHEGYKIMSYNRLRLSLVFGVIMGTVIVTAGLIVLFS